MERKTKSVTPDEFYSTHQASVNASQIKIKAIGNAIFKLIKETNDCVKVDKKSKAWKEYQEYINDIVIDAISKAICTSLSSLNKLVDVNKRKDTAYFPWFRIGVQLVNNSILFNPEFKQGEVISIKGIIDSLVKDFLEVAINI